MATESELDTAELLCSGLLKIRQKDGSILYTPGKEILFIRQFSDKSGGLIGTKSGSVLELAEDVDVELLIEVWRTVLAAGGEVDGNT